MKILKTELKETDITKEICKNFTIDYTTHYEFKVPYLDKSVLPEFNIGFITGQSGSGKSLMLKEFGEEKTINWRDNDAVCSHFENYDDAVNRLQAVGFNSIPQWLLPYKILSQGQQYRVNLARAIESNSVRDEFTSTIDRNTAMGLCNSLQRYIRTNDLKNIVFAGVHQDVIEYLRPDWVYYTDDDSLTINSAVYDITDIDKKEFTKKPFMKI